MSDLCDACQRGDRRACEGARGSRSRRARAWSRPPSPLHLQLQPPQLGSKCRARWFSKGLKIEAPGPPTEPLEAFPCPLPPADAHAVSALQISRGDIPGKATACSSERLSRRQRRRSLPPEARENLELITGRDELSSPVWRSACCRRNNDSGLGWLP